MITSSPINERYFRTANFYAAAFLFAKGLDLIDIDRSNARRSEFVFLDSVERKEWLQSFSFANTDSPKVAIDARTFVSAIRMLKEKLYQER